jgi:integrase
VNSGSKRVLSEKEISAVLDKATEGFRPLLAVLIFGGLRLGEALGLKWEAVDFDEGAIRVR